jgi:hypothetical protein
LYYKLGMMAVVEIVVMKLEFVDTIGEVVDIE